MRTNRRRNAVAWGVMVVVNGLCLGAASAREAGLAPASQPSDNGTAPYLGQYELAGQTVTVDTRDDKKLTVTVPGQPTYGLEPIAGKEHTFKIEIPGGVEGYSLSFTMEKGRAKAIVFHQPNGEFTAPRKVQAAGTAALSDDEFNQQFSVLVQDALKAWEAPGVAIGVVRHGEVVLLKGFGQRDVEGSLPVTEHTRFAIGSTTKAFTAAVVATLVDEQKLQWDKPVRDVWPEFRLKDEMASARITPRDLLTHRSGLPRHDLVWYGSSATREELISRVRYLEPTADLRVRFQYNNFMFCAAGVLAQKMTGKPWEDLVRDRIFVPLGMNESNFSVSELSGVESAIGYQSKDDKLQRMPYRNIDAMGPAGSINSTASDMVKWIKLHLDSGKVGERQVVSAESIKQMHSPQMVIAEDASPVPRPPEIKNSSYGLGWMVSVYRGHSYVEHGGNIDGFSAEVALLPDDGIGIVILSNLNGTPLPSVLALSACDRLLGLSPIDWNAKGLELRKTMKDVTKAKEAESDAQRVQGTSPSHKLDDYAGEFENPGYGVLKVAFADGKLSAAYNSLTSGLDHWHYDVFRATSDEVEGLKVMFLTNERGDINRVTATFDPSAPPVEFTRKVSASLSDLATLSKYVGVYELRGVELKVALRGKALTVTVPGQPTYDLAPFKPDAFDLKLPGDIQGFSVQFTMKDGVAVEAVFVQPNGTFKATRKAP